MGKDIEHTGHRRHKGATTGFQPGRLLSARLGIPCALALLAPSAALAADDLLRGETVMSRSRPEVDPIGVTAGDYLLLPRLNLAASYDDNILATENDHKSGLRSEISPELSLRSNWGAHALNLFANANIGRFADYSSEDYDDWEIAADGRLDIHHSIQLNAGASFGHDHVERTAPDDANGTEPTQYDRATAFARYTQAFGRYSLRLDADVKDKDFEDVPAIRLGLPVVINQDDRDRTEYTLGVRGGYEFLPDYEAYARLTGNQRDYDERQDFTGADRSSDGYEAVAGVALDLGGIVFGDVFAGYISQDYTAPFPDIDAPVFGTLMYWNPSGLTTFGVAVQRSINEATSAVFSGYTSTETALTVDHELRRDILLNGGIHYILDDYEGIGAADRDDTTWDVQLGMTYLANRYLQTTLQYHWIERESDESSGAAATFNSFDKNLFIIQLDTRL